MPYRATSGLHLAAQNGDVAALQRLLSEGALVDLVSEIRYAVEESSDEERSSWRCTPLHAIWGAGYGLSAQVNLGPEHIKCIKLLIAQAKYYQQLVCAAPCAPLLREDRGGRELPKLRARSPPFPVGDVRSQVSAPPPQRLCRSSSSSGRTSGIIKYTRTLVKRPLRLERHTLARLRMRERERRRVET